MKPIHHISPSQAKLMKDCPLKWYFYHSGYPREDGDKRHAHCGTAVHLTVEKMLKGEKVVHEDIIRNVPVDYDGNTTELTPDMVDKYYACYKAWEDMGIKFSNPQPEKELSTTVEGIKVVGKIDIIDDNAIYDLKTGTYNEGDDLQAAFYQRLARDNGMARGNTYFLYLKTGEIRRMPDFPDDYIDAVIIHIKDVYESRAFHPRVGNGCTWCDYKGPCSEVTGRDMR